MNGFKYLNDNFGHLEGDNSLKTKACCICDRFKNPRMRAFVLQRFFNLLAE